MRYKASFLTGLAAGYVLGTRAGRERYEQIRRMTRSAWKNPQVQRAADTMGNQAGHLVGSAARAAADKGKAVTEKVGDKLPSRISDKLPASFHRHEQGDEWRSYAHSGNGHMVPPGPAATPGTTGI